MIPAIGKCQVLGINQILGFDNIGFNLYPGFLAAHRDDVKNMEAHTIGFEISLIKKNHSSIWAKAYKVPQIHWGFMYMYLGKPQLTGNVFAILPSFSRIIGHIGNTNIRFRAGSGVGYLTKKFEPYTNRRNQSIGSHLNGAMQLYLNLEGANPDAKYDYNFGIGITHFSNGSFRVPNLGVNMPSLLLGISTNSSYSDKKHTVDTVPTYPWKYYFAYAFKERTLTKPHGFHIFNLNVVHITRRSTLRDWRLGGDIFLDKTHHYLDYPSASLKGLKPWEMTEIGVFGGHQWLVSRIHFKIDIGFYAYKPSNNKFFTYQRMGFDINVTDKFFISWNLKTHFGIADHFTWGIGYKL